MSELKRDGITVYKVNSKTNERVEVGYVALNGRLIFISPKSEVMPCNFNTYRRNFEVLVANDKAETHTSIKHDSREVLVKDKEGSSLSIGYFDRGKLVLWSQYE